MPIVYFKPTPKYRKKMDQQEIDRCNEMLKDAQLRQKVNKLKRKDATV